MFKIALSAALAVASSARQLSSPAAEATAQLNQLETARLPQQVQRVEFGVEGPESAFKFSFADPVRASCLCHTLCGTQCLYHTAMAQHPACAALSEPGCILGAPMCTPVMRQRPRIATLGTAPLTGVPDVQAVAGTTESDAVLQLTVTKKTNPFLSTLAGAGEAQFLTALKPCSILLPHIHPRANEFYSVIFGGLRSHQCMRRDLLPPPCYELCRRAQT
jgi:hypothetical protein